MKTRRLSRSEFVTCGVLLIGAAGFGIYKLNEQLYIANLPQLEESETQTVAFGETLSLTYREIGQENNVVPWTGDVEMTLSRVKLYGSYTEALASEEKLSLCTPNGGLHDESDPFLVVGIEVRNVDASQAGFSWDTDADSIPQGCVGLNTMDFMLNDHPDSTMLGNRDMPVCACVNGADLSDYYQSTLFTLAQNETKNVYLGFTLEDGKEGSLSGACLQYRSPYDSLDLGL